MYWNEYFLTASVAAFGLTLTWDVLKCVAIYNIFIKFKININMRCIEIRYRKGARTYEEWLTLTWDVLKWAGWF